MAKYRVTKRCFWDNAQREVGEFVVTKKALPKKGFPSYLELVEEHDKQPIQTNEPSDDKSGEPGIQDEEVI